MGDWVHLGEDGWGGDGDLGGTLLLLACAGDGVIGLALTSVVISDGTGTARASLIASDASSEST